MRYVVFLIVAVSSIVSYGQFGIKAGLNITNYETELVNGSKGSANVKYSFSGGLLTEFQVHDKIKLSPEILYSNEGGQFESFFGETKIDLHYLLIPLGIKYNLADNWNINSGPFVSYLIAAKRSADLGPFDIYGDYKPLNYGINIGLEGEIENFRLGVKHMRSLSDILRDQILNLSTQSTQLYVTFFLKDVVRS